jgi:hypothetical protein
MLNELIKSSKIAVGLLLVVLMVGYAGSTIAATPTPHRQVAERHHDHERLHQAGWIGAGIAAGRVAGPGGSAAVGAAKYRKDLKAGWHRRARAIVKIGGPIAAGVVAGPVGSASYAAVEHRDWIKRHILRLKPHESTETAS